VFHAPFPELIHVIIASYGVFKKYFLLGIPGSFFFLFIVGEKKRRNTETENIKMEDIEMYSSGFL